MLYILCIRQLQMVAATVNKGSIHFTGWAKCRHFKNSFYLQLNVSKVSVWRLNVIRENNTTPKHSYYVFITNKRHFLDSFAHLFRLPILAPCCLFHGVPDFQKFQNDRTETTKHWLKEMCHFYELTNVLSNDSSVNEGWLSTTQGSG